MVSRKYVKKSNFVIIKVEIIRILVKLKIQLYAWRRTDRFKGFKGAGN